MMDSIANKITTTVAGITIAASHSGGGEGFNVVFDGDGDSIQGDDDDDDGNIEPK